MEKNKSVESCNMGDVDEVECVLYILFEVLPLGYIGIVMIKFLEKCMQKN